MNSRQLLPVVAVLLCAMSTARAQQSSPSTAAEPSVATDTASAAPHTARLSTIDRSSDAVRRPAALPGAPLPATSAHLGEAKAEMVVGGAAIVVGALVGGGGGQVLIFGGAVIGLYGLWNYLK
jgi:hypothetical protein